MDRRQFIHVATAALPVPAFCASRADPACGIVQFGVITVGGIGRAILDDRILNLPYRPRTIAINTDAAGLDKVSADRKILVDGGGVLPAHIADAVAGLEVAFLVAGMGGAEGTAISPVVAQVLRGNPLKIQKSRRESIDHPRTLPMVSLGVNRIGMVRSCSRTSVQKSS